MDEKLAFGERLKILLKLKKMSQRELSDISNVDASQISKLITQRRKNPTLREVKAFSNALELPIDVLLGDINMFDSLLQYYARNENNYLWSF